MFNKLLLNKFARNFVGGVAWRVLLYASSFFLNIAIANFMGAEMGGRFYLLLTNLSLGVLFFSFGLETAISYFQSKGELRTGYLYLLGIVWSLLATGVIIFLYKALSVPGIIEKNAYAGYALFFIGANILSNCLAAIYFANSNSKTPSLILALTYLVLLFLVPGFVLSHDFFSVQDYVRIYLALNCLPAVGLSILLFYKHQPPPANSAKIYLSFRKVIPFALLSFAANFLLALLMRIDYWIVDFFCTSDQLGNYMQAGKVSQLIVLLPTIASNILFPLMVKQLNSGSEVITKVNGLSKLYFFIGAAFCLVTGAIGWFLFPWVYGQSYDTMHHIFLLTAPGFLAYAALFPLSTYFISRNKIRINIIGLLWTMIILIILEILLVPKYKTYGAATSFSLAFAFYFLYLKYFMRKVTSRGVDIDLVTSVAENRSSTF